jgi:hypothetical protein
MLKNRETTWRDVLPALAPVAATRTGLKLVPVMNDRKID